MAYIINPDGTITTVEADYDRYGNLKEKINSEILKEQEITYSSKTEIHRAETKGKSKVLPKYKPVARKVKPSKERIFVTYAEIDMFFKDRIASKKGVSTAEYIRITDKLPNSLKDYFITRYRKYLGYEKDYDEDFRKRKAFKKPKIKKKKNKTPHVVREVKAFPSNHTGHYLSGHSLGEIATFSSLHKRTPEGDMVNGRSLSGASRKPKYGYARDRYGRVQERDSFNEDRRNEFRNAQIHQNNYDYSSYDENDDHDGAYNNWE